MKHYRKGLSLLILLVVLFTCLFCIIANAEDGVESEEVRVPILLEVPYAIAGAEFEIEYTSGLKLLSFEKSQTIQPSSTTPVVEKNGKTYLGFYHASNDFAPQDGVLDIGYLVFEYSGEPDQEVVVTEAKYVQVIDKDNTNSELLTINEAIAVPLASGAELRIGKKSYALWIALAIALVVIVAGIIVYRRKKTA